MTSESNAIASRNVALGQAQLKETQKHNRKTESIASRQTAVTEAKLPYEQKESAGRYATNYINSFANVLGSAGSLIRGVGSVVDGIIPG